MKKINENVDVSISEPSFSERNWVQSRGIRKKGNKKILLVLSGTEVENRSLNYALNFASRNHSSIEVLSLMLNHETLDILNAGLENMEMDFPSISINKASGCIKSALIEHILNRYDIELVIIESETALESECAQTESKLQDMLPGLKCPLVIVSKLKNI